MIQATVTTQMVFKGTLKWFTAFWNLFDEDSVIAEPLPGVHMCAVFDTPKHIWIYWMAVVIFETVLFFMAVAIMIRDYWMMRIVRNHAVNDKPSLLRLILRDSVAYFFV